MVYKMNESIIMIQAEAINPIQTNVVFWSHDRGTAKLRMKLVRKNGIPQSLPEGTTVPIRLMFKSATAEGGYGKHDYLATVEDPVNGIVSIVLEDNILGYVGTVEGSVYIDFPNDRSLDTAGRFTFYIKRSPIDDSTPELEDYYFNGFSQTIDKVEKILADGKQEIEQKITESETQIEAKVKDTNDKITKANQDVATLNTNIDKANDRIDQTNQQISDLGKLKKMYSNSIDFGDYDYSGRPNLFLNLDFSKLSRNASAITEPPAYVKDGGSHFVLDFSDPSANGVDRSVYIPAVGRLEKGATYIATVPIMISDDFSTAYGASPIYPYCVSANNVETRVTSLYPDNSCRGKWGFIKKTFTVPANASDGEFTFFKVYSSDKQVGKLYIGYDIKIEKVTSTSDTATPYQPNLLDAPYYLSKVALGENIADPAVKFPISSSSEGIYSKNALEDFVLGETYTVTIGATKPDSQTIRVYLAQKQFSDFKPVEGLVDTWVATVSITQLGENAKGVYLFQTPNTSLGSCTIKWLKIEKGDTRTPNISQFKYFGEGLKDSNNPNDYSWDITPEYTEKGLNNTVSLTDPQSVEGLKNFEDGLQLKGISVVQDNFTSKAVTTKNITDFTEDSIVRFERWGRLVIANIEITNKSANFAGWKNLMAFPSGYTPISLVGWGGTLSNKTNRNPALSVYANSSGISVMISSADLPANQRCSGTVAYFTNDEWPQG
ncbi:MULTISPECIES: BppU family phage baseplate upper protein [Enterococcus]|uniref:BppU family phage baseplate upper protein n=1 Tax=Enterococcus TaxID=1350 RepID=UPI001D06DE2A|nr:MULTISPECIES: BppU family phage baseplate upper protein [Enterococcus]MEB5659406.1 BppU family phage baseplate upper protein [Enterococcus faecium]